MTRACHRHRDRRALALREVVVMLGVLAALLGLTAPLLQRTSCDSMKARSAAHLAGLAIAHASYSADWNDRQFTLLRDDLGAHGGDCEAYQSAAGCHPPVVLGEDCDGVLRSIAFGCGSDGGDCADLELIKPFHWDWPEVVLSGFKLTGVRAFNVYVNGRMFDPTFYAPHDVVALDAVAPLLDEPCEFAADDVAHAFTGSYVLSPAAMYDPGVYRSESRGGFQHPDSLDDGYASPAASLALYPDQKSRLMEHHWLQTRDFGRCNDGLGLAGLPFECAPWQFNHGHRSNPMTLFYDGHVRGLSLIEAKQSDARVREMSNQAESLWSRDTPLGEEGYALDVSADVPSGPGQGSSMHIMTTDGIRGRDTLR